MELHGFLARNKFVTQPWTFLLPGRDDSGVRLRLRRDEADVLRSRSQVDVRPGVSLRLLVADLGGLVILGAVEAVTDLLADVVVVGKLAPVPVSAPSLAEVVTNFLPIEGVGRLLPAGHAHVLRQHGRLLVLPGPEGVAEHGGVVLQPGDLLCLLHEGGLRQPVGGEPGPTAQERVGNGFFGFCVGLLCVEDSRLLTLVLITA